jgi:hypothetical protein
VRVCLLTRGEVLAWIVAGVVMVVAVTALLVAAWREDSDERWAEWGREHHDR